MRNKPTYSPLQLIFFGGMASASICSVSFKGSFVDCLVSFPLGAFLVTVQLLSVKNELYSNGFLVLCGSLELSSRNMVSGAVRLCYALVYSLFLGFGLAIGAEVYEKITHHSVVGPEDNACALNHDPDVWWQSTPSLWWAFLSVPMFSLFLSLRNQAPWNRKEIVLLVVISCIGWVTNHYASLVFPNQSDISSAVGAFAVGFVANVYGRVFKGNAFVVMITGILFQVPSGLSNGGLFTFAEQSTSGQTNSYLSGFQTALQLVSVSLGLTVGLGISLVLVFPIQSRKRQAGVFSL
ncbi:hypothetical protein OF83DRAFT_1180231 [Amylostereum chailletii]|nr:hypothetical protein OF83DRAFT_1180231 [Amylostereum chailletii]